MRGGAAGFLAYRTALAKLVGHETGSDYVEWRAELLAGGLSPKRAGKALQVLSQILASGEEGGRLARNAAMGVKPPKVQRKEMHFLDAEQVEWLAAAADRRYRSLILFAAYTGCGPASWSR